MEIKTNTRTQKRTFIAGDKFPVLVQGEAGNERLFFTDTLSLITRCDSDPTIVGTIVPDTRSVYDPFFTVLTGKSVTLTQD